MDRELPTGLGLLGGVGVCVRGVGACVAFATA